MTIATRRLVDAPIIGPETHPSIGTNIQGPSLIETPDWLPNRMGRYYLYFADHKGRHIRLAYADDLTGPWTVHPPGALQLAHSGFPAEDLTISDEKLARLEATYREALGESAMPPDVRGDVTTAHIASPDVHVDHENHRIVMYFHGLERVGYQCSRVAVSDDGMHFVAQPEILGPSYFRVFRWRDHTYALAMPGKIYRSADGLTGFELGPQLFNPAMRHSAVRVLEPTSTLEVYWTQVGDAPERIYRSTIDLPCDWMSWTESAPEEILRPERSWEGANAPLEPSVRGAVNHPVNQLRDPAIHIDSSGDVFLLYAVAGESGIAIAALGEMPNTTR